MGRQGWGWAADRFRDLFLPPRSRQECADQEDGAAQIKETMQIGRNRERTAVMRNLRFSVVLSVVLLALLFAGVLSGDGTERPRPDRDARLLIAEMPGRYAAVRRAPVASAATPLLGAILIAEYDFDEAGLPDPEGWSGEDVWAPQDTFFHVDDFSGLGSGFTPIQGTKSLWCETADSVRYWT